MSNLTDFLDTVNSVNGRKGSVTLTKTDVGLNNVDNTSDANKPVSSAVSTALNGKLDASANAVSATRLLNSRNINGVAFDGTSDISLPDPILPAASTSSAGIVQLNNTTTSTSTTQAATAAAVKAAMDAANAGVTESAISTPNNALIKSALNAGGNAPVYACRAWVNFNGRTYTPTIRMSGNVSSLTYNNDGDYTVNFMTAMPDENYSLSGAVASTRISTSFGLYTNNKSHPASLMTTTACRIFTNIGGSIADSATVTIQFIR